MAITKIELEKIILDSFPNAKVIITDFAGDEDHYSLEIADNSFIGKTLLVQHRMVKAALASALGSNLHAITIKTLIAI